MCLFSAEKLKSVGSFGVYQHLSNTEQLTVSQLKLMFSYSLLLASNIQTLSLVCV